ncbi:hypothetical protein GCM10025865_19550 [Paraoerskovia sediminicola]|uniref:DNA recombination protein RmuC n=1 Tax=Paraoerskovia sediminicola TaxID=1138587 RepID=A0ABM8G3N0_9CELL|nr:DNA recombination protein RmuC [Paraoerskovia sediminicola]BDZ42656.1 hypothetical protein GCM10025865_19550 [Paraoerskovia sediminicola]
MTTTILFAVLAFAAGAALAWTIAGSRARTQTAALVAEADRDVARAEQAGADRLASAQRVHEAELAAAIAKARATDEVAAQLETQFKAVAADALGANNEQFMTLASQRLAEERAKDDGHTAARQKAVADMVAPLATALEQVREKVAVADRDRAAGNAAISEQVRLMVQGASTQSAATAQLVTVLRGAQARGQWGEMQLRRVAEASGMLPRIDFVEQEHKDTDDGALRPDMVVRLAGGKQVVVDAKVSLVGLLDAGAATDPVVREERLDAHVRHVRKHVEDLSRKKYWDQFSPAPEFVVMFIPAESFLQAAVERDPSLVEWAFEKNVIVATPTTLLALLRTVAYAWRQEAMSENAEQVLVLGKELHDRLSTMGGHLANVGRRIGSTAKAYNEAIASLESRVFVSARRFKALGVVDADLDMPATLDPKLSTISAPELVASAEGRLLNLQAGRDELGRDEEADTTDAEDDVARDRDERTA